MAPDMKRHSLLQRKRTTFAISCWLAARPVGERWIGVRGSCAGEGRGVSIRPGLPGLAPVPVFFAYHKLADYLHTRLQSVS